MLIRWFAPHDFVTLAVKAGVHALLTSFLIPCFSVANSYSFPISSPSSISRMRSSILILFYRLQAHPTAVGGLYFLTCSKLQRFISNYN
jgi:hypothetical protein